MRAFTLVELLMVLAIIVTLMSMLLPVWGVVTRAAKRSATEAVLSRTEAALTLYGREMRVFPHQQEYPANGTDSPFMARDFVNRLGYTLDGDIAADDADHVRTDASTAADRFRYEMVLNVSPDDAANGAKWYQNVAGSESSAGPLAITAAQILWEVPTASASAKSNGVHPIKLVNWFTADGNAKKGAGNVPVAMIVNRLFQERVRVAIGAGNVAIAGTLASLPPHSGGYPARSYAASVYDLRATRVLPAAMSTSATKPGWASDYLGDGLESRYRTGDAIIDAWGNPLVYVHQLSPGLDRSSTVSLNGTCDVKAVPPFDTRFYGLRARPILPIDLALDAAAEQGIDGRIRLSSTDCGWGVPTPAHATYMPSIAQAMASDIRYYAAPAYTKDFELWSAGPDGRFCWRRSDAANRDNIAIRKYNKGLE